MKKISIVLCCLLVSCYDGGVPELKIDLRGQPLSVIKRSIAGKWKLDTSSGGDIIYWTTKFTQTYFEFDFGKYDVFIRTDSGKVTVSSIIKWEKATQYGDSVFVCKYNYEGGYSGFYPWGVQNNTLYLQEPDAWGQSYMLTKVE